jgi:hypothetical protein
VESKGKGARQPAAGHLELAGGPPAEKEHPRQSANRRRIGNRCRHRRCRQSAEQIRALEAEGTRCCGGGDGPAEGRADGSGGQNLSAPFAGGPEAQDPGR